MDEEEFDDPWLAAIDYIEKYRAGTLPKRRLAEEEKEEEEVEDAALVPVNERGLQDMVLDITVKDCLFSVSNVGREDRAVLSIMAKLIAFLCLQNLQQVERKLGVEFGVVSVKSRDHIVTVEDCTFTKNKYGNQELTVSHQNNLSFCFHADLISPCFASRRPANGVITPQATSLSPRHDRVVQPVQ